MTLPSCIVTLVACLWQPNKKKDRQTEPNPNDSLCGTLSVESNMVNDSTFMHCHTGGVYMAAKLIKKTDRQNLTLMTLNAEPCLLSPIWLMILSSEHCHTGGVFMAAKLKKKDRQTEPNPNDSQCGTLKVGSNMVNDSSFMHCHTGCMFMAAKLKRQTDRT